MLFEDGLIRNFIVDDKYDDIIRVAVFNHNKLEIEAGLNEKSMLFAKIIRDADKLDNFRVKRDEKIQAKKYFGKWFNFNISIYIFKYL